MTRPEERFKWTDEAVAELRRIADARQPASAAAAALGCSRVAAIGKARRLGFSFNSGTSGPPANDAARRRPKRAPRKAAKAAAKRPPKASPASKPESASRPRTEAKPEPATPRTLALICAPVRFADIEDGRCKWPVDNSLAAPTGPDMLVCGAKVAGATGGTVNGVFDRGQGTVAQSFCLHHLKIGTVPR